MEIMCNNMQSDINIQNIISVFQEMNQYFTSSLKIIWPTVGSRGFTESNMVQSFLFYCKSKFNAIIYSEVPFLYRSRIDGLAFIDFNQSAHILLIEAKRVKENQYNSAYFGIGRDTNRMLETDRIINILERIIKKDIISVTVQPIFLADVWVGNKNRSEEVKAKWESKNEQDSLFFCWETKFSDAIWRSESGKVKYHQMLAIGGAKYFYKNNENKWDIK